MAIVVGVVKQNAIVLPEGIQLPEGATVEIRVRRPKRKRGTQPISELLFKQRLLETGLISAIRPVSPSVQENHEPIAVPGKPLSEIIIEDRR